MKNGSRPVTASSGLPVPRMKVSSCPVPSSAPTVAAVAACRAVAAAEVAPARTSWRQGYAEEAAVEEVSAREGKPESAAAPVLVSVPVTRSATGLDGSPEPVEAPSCRCLLPPVPPWVDTSSCMYFLPLDAPWSTSTRSPLMDGVFSVKAPASTAHSTMHAARKQSTVELGQAWVRAVGLRWVGAMAGDDAATREEEKLLGVGARNGGRACWALLVLGIPPGCSSLEAFQVRIDGMYCLRS